VSGAVSGVGVLGVGLDVVDVAAFTDQLGDAASGFVAGTFTPAEQAGAPAEPARRAWHLAGRFAAKEAFVKAWSGARRGQHPELAAVDLREVEVVADRHGRPGLVLHGAVRAGVARLCPGGQVRAHVSLSHDGPVAAAVVVLDAVAGGER